MEVSLYVAKSPSDFSRVHFRSIRFDRVVCETDCGVEAGQSSGDSSRAVASLTRPAGSHFLVKDRDLGQTFRTPPGSAIRLEAITVRVGPAPLGNAAGIAGASNAPVFIQIFEVSGTPVIHDNGTAGTTTVSVSYPVPTLSSPPRSSR
jgi:hypothetical protein